jgi:hypothetical protein
MRVRRQGDRERETGRRLRQRHLILNGGVGASAEQDRQHFHGSKIAGSMQSRVSFLQYLTCQGRERGGDLRSEGGVGTSGEQLGDGLRVASDAGTMQRRLTILVGSVRASAGGSLGSLQNSFGR